MSLPIFRQRNQSIKAEFNLLLRSQMPTMLIYAKIAAEYGISEERPPPPHTKHHPKGTLHPLLRPLLHHNTCNTCHICNISI